MMMDNNIILEKGLRISVQWTKKRMDFTKKKAQGVPGNLDEVKNKNSISLKDCEYCSD